MQLGLAHLDRRIAPDEIESRRLVDVVGRHDLHVVEVEPSGIVGGESSSALVHVDRHHTGGRPTAGECESDRAGTASEVEKDSTRGRFGRVGEQELGADVEAAMGEDGTVTRVVERVVGKDDRHGARVGGRLGGGVEVVRHLASSLAGMTYEIRTFGDPVLASKAAAVSDIDGKIVRIVDQMFETLYETETGIGLAAPQVGIARQIFVWDIDGEPEVIFNPVIAESDGEWTYEEGCLSIPGLYVEMVRPKTVLMTGIDIDGNEISFEADELEARLFQHELDHLNGVLMFDRMQPEQREQALAEYRRLATQADAAAPRRLRAE